MKSPTPTSHLTKRPRGKNASSPDCRVFLVEDHAGMRQLTQEMLERLTGIHFSGSCSSGEEALEILDTAQPDILLADLSLPGISGVELIRKVKERMPHVRCLVLSAHSDVRYAHRALEVGACIYVPKGDPAALSEALHRCRSGDLG